MACYILDKAYSVAHPGGVAAHRAVVQGPNPGECALPADANAGALLGVTVHAQSNVGRPVSVRKAGIARLAAAGPIDAGAPVNVADAAGRVKAIDELSGVKINCLGFAETPAAAEGDLIEVFLSIHERVA